MRGAFGSQTPRIRAARATSGREGSGGSGAEGAEGAGGAEEGARVEVARRRGECGGHPEACIAAEARDVVTVIGSVGGRVAPPVPAPGSACE